MLHVRARDVTKLDSSALSIPKSPVIEMGGKYSAFTAPICVLAATRRSSKARISGRRSSNAAGSPQECREGLVAPSRSDHAQYPQEAVPGAGGWRLLFGQ